MRESFSNNSVPYAIQLREVGYRYPRTEEWALNGFSLKVPLGSIFVITGPTGCGKTTLLRVVRGFHKEFGGKLVGEIQILGQDLTNLDSSLGLKIGAVFQNPAGQLHQLRVIDEIMSGPMYQGLLWEECQKRAREAIDSVSVENLLNRNPLKLSGGEQQKVGLAACLAMKSDILLLDEPFSYLEENTAKELLKILVNLRCQGRTIVLVTHNLKQVIEYADKIALLDKGKCLLVGTPEQVLRSDDLRKLMPLSSIRAETDLVKRDDLQERKMPWGESARRKDLTENCIETKTDRMSVEQTRANQKILELKQVEYVYPNGTPGLAGVSLTILAGEVLGIAGCNGSGKTTLAKVLVGLLRPSRGELLISGLNAGSSRPWEIVRQIGYVAQFPSEMLFASSVLEECAFGPKCLGIADPNQRVQEALQLVGLLKYQHRHPDSLSHGERRLLTIAAILVNQPQVLVLDEPEFGLDARSCGMVMSAVEALNKMGKTIVLISHNLETLMRICDRIVLTKEGRIMRTCSPGEILSDLSEAESDSWKPLTV